jgi:hypothetical protein
MAVKNGSARSWPVRGSPPVGVDAAPPPVPGAEDVLVDVVEPALPDGGRNGSLACDQAGAHTSANTVARSARTVATRLMVLTLRQRVRRDNG